jgi:hypothetical protein
VPGPVRPLRPYPALSGPIRPYPVISFLRVPD